jgi:hypothetical protein
MAAAEAAQMAADEAEAAKVAAEMAAADAAAEQALADKEAAEAAVALTKTAAALKSALGTELAMLSDTTATTLTGAGLMLATEDANDSEPRMKAGDSAGALGDWAGTNYAHTNVGTKVSNSAIVYNNRAAATMKPFAEGAEFGGNEDAFNTAYTRSTRTLDLGTDPVSSASIKGDGFPTAGETTYTPDGVTGSTVIAGTYQGASGNYRCAGDACTAAPGAGGTIDLGGQWYFIHDADAMVTTRNANYLYFGWWLRKDDGKPIAANTFTGMGGTVATSVDLTQVTGSADYAGAAAGKFAISDPLGDDNAGHFTADASLTAKFGGSATGGGLSGTIDNFVLNDADEVPWSVSLSRRSWATTDGGTELFDDPDTTPRDESATGMGTVWSIDGNAAAASGSWDATMYDEKASGPADDGSNVPTSVTGTFQSDFGSTHSMVGAFGATKE